MLAHADNGLAVLCRGFVDYVVSGKMGIITELEYTINQDKKFKYKEYKLSSGRFNES